MFNPEVIAVCPGITTPGCMVRIKTVDGKFKERLYSQRATAFAACYKQWKGHGKSIQEAFPPKDWSAMDREFIQSGLTDEEWDKLFGPDRLSHG